MAAQRRYGAALALAFCFAAVAASPALAAEDEQRHAAQSRPSASTAEPAKDEPKDAVGEHRPNRTRQERSVKIPPSSRRSSPPPEFRGPDVTLIAGEERTIHEYRHNGQLRMIKVVPKLGKPYFLSPRDPTRGFGDLEQADSLIAEWVLWEF